METLPVFDYFLVVRKFRVRLSVETWGTLFLGEAGAGGGWKRGFEVVHGATFAVARTRSRQRPKSNGKRQRQTSTSSRANPGMGAPAPASAPVLAAAQLRAPSCSQGGPFRSRGVREGACPASCPGLGRKERKPLGAFQVGGEGKRRGQAQVRPEASAQGSAGGRGRFSRRTGWREYGRPWVAPGFSDRRGGGDMEAMSRAGARCACACVRQRLLRILNSKRVGTTTESLGRSAHVWRTVVVGSGLRAPGFAGRSSRWRNEAGSKPGVDSFFCGGLLFREASGAWGQLAGGGTWQAAAAGRQTGAGRAGTWPGSGCALVW